MQTYTELVPLKYEKITTNNRGYTDNFYSEANVHAQTDLRCGNSLILRNLYVIHTSLICTSGFVGDAVHSMTCGQLTRIMHDVIFQ